MKGKIIVTDDIKTVKESFENDIELYMSWTTSTIESGEKAIFKIVYIDKKKYQKSRTYRLPIYYKRFHIR
jgi:hypothetical protein